MAQSKNDLAWEKLFTKHNILHAVKTNGFYEISAKSINEFREARLMTKFDHSSNLPTIFEQNNLSILPITRGSYLIGCFEIFHDFVDNATSIQQVMFPNNLESINVADISSEATAINCAYVSNILHNFSGEENLVPTVSGRMSSSQFDFYVNNTALAQTSFINVNNSQIEIDGGYEGNKSLILIEAKNYISDDFLIRQLYYPFRLWQNKVSKPVRSIFLTYTNGVFDLREYQFSQINNYNSLNLVHHQKYTIQTQYINLELLQNIVKTTPQVNEPLNIPFPQADSFARIINLCELIHDEGCLSKDTITTNYDFDRRQTDYYVNAARYLGLVCQGDDLNFYLTQLGLNLFKLSLGQRQIELIKLIVKHSVFNRVLSLTFSNSRNINRDEVIEIMKQSNLTNLVSDSTYYRRASTVIAWINWILNQVEE